MEPRYEEALRGKLNTARIIGYAMFASLLIYVVVAGVLKAQSSPFEGFGKGEMSADVLIPVALVIALLIALAISPLKRSVQRGNVRTALTKPEAERPQAVGQAFLIASVIAFYLAEGIALVGFVCFLMLGHEPIFYALLAVSLVLLAVHFPTQRNWEEAFREYQAAGTKV